MPEKEISLPESSASPTVAAPLRKRTVGRRCQAAPRRLPGNVNKRLGHRRLLAGHPPPRPRRRGDATDCGTLSPSNVRVVCPRPGGGAAQSSARSSPGRRTGRPGARAGGGCGDGPQIASFPLDGSHLPVSRYARRPRDCGLRLRLRGSAPLLPAGLPIHPAP